MTDRPWPDLAGGLVPGGHVLPVRVYFEDTDLSGFVYHANYLKFMERGRSDLLRLIGIGHLAIKNEVTDGGAFAVRRITVDYHRPARIDDVIEIETRPVSVSGARINLEQTVRRDGAILVSAAVIVVLVSPSGRALRLPAAVRKRMLDLCEETG